jgi:hypothetical protein
LAERSLGPAFNEAAVQRPHASGSTREAQEDIIMLRKFVLAAVAAASLGVGLAGAATSASAERWHGPRHGYSSYDRGYGPPPWVVRKWFSRRDHHHGGPAYHGPRERRFEGRPGPYRPHW